MARRLEVHPEAALDGRAAYLWYRERNPRAADAFLAELDAAIERINTSPETWPSHLEETRRYLLRRFPYGVVYRMTQDVVSIVAIAHTSRRPGYWKERA